MTIPYFSTNQNVVFIPALLALLAATVVVCLPIVFAPTLRRSSRRGPVIALVAVFAVVGLVGTAILAGSAFRTLGDERARVQAQIAQIYGLQLTGGDVGELIDGGKPAPSLPSEVAELRLDPAKKHALKLVADTTGGDVFSLTLGGKPLPKAS